MIGMWAKAALLTIVLSTISVKHYTNMFPWEYVTQFLNRGKPESATANTSKAKNRSIDSPNQESNSFLASVFDEKDRFVPPNGLQEGNFSDLEVTVSPGKTIIINKGQGYVRLRIRLIGKIRIDGKDYDKAQFNLTEAVSVPGNGSFPAELQISKY